MEQDDYWVTTFDEVGARYTEAQPLDVLRKETIADAIEAVRRGDLPIPPVDVEEWCATQFSRYVMPQRAVRANRLTHDVESILDGFEEGDGDYVDPLLSQVHRLGDGTDKLLRWWTRDDWHDWAYGRLANAAKVSAAAHESDDLAQRIIARLEDGGFGYTGELFS